MLFYVMSPYSGSRYDMFHRHFVTTHFASKLSEEGIPVLSPIMHWHFSAHTHGLPTDAEFWTAHNQHLFEACDGGILFQQPGWEQSKGIEKEMKWFAHSKKPVYLLDLESQNVDGYTERCFEILLKNLRHDFPLLREVPISAAAP